MIYLVMCQGGNEAEHYEYPVKFYMNQTDAMIEVQRMNGICDSFPSSPESYEENDLKAWEELIEAVRRMLEDKHWYPGRSYSFRPIPMGS